MYVSDPRGGLRYGRQWSKSYSGTLQSRSSLLYASMLRTRCSDYARRRLRSQSTKTLICSSRWLVWSRNPLVSMSDFMLFCSRITFKLQTLNLSFIIIIGIIFCYYYAFFIAFIIILFTFTLYHMSTMVFIHTHICTHMYTHTHRA